jgi:hypothetical protein
MMNKTYLKTIRANSCYPTFRAVVTVVTITTYVIAVVMVVAGAFITGTTGNGTIVGFYFAGAVVIALLAKAGQEVSLMIADIADATIDVAGHRNNVGP